MAGGDEDDAGYAGLPSFVQEKIDDAFDSAILSCRSPSSRPPAKRRKLDYEPPSSESGTVPDMAAGGFLMDESYPAGGFLPEGREASEDPLEDEERTRIPLSLIPTALELVGLEGDDEDILSVLRNAASGWGDGASGQYDGLVSRRDWRAVCAAVLDRGSGGNEMDTDDDRSSAQGVAMDECSGSGEEYVDSVGSFSEKGSDDGDDDYHEGGLLVAERTRRTRSKPVGGSTKAQGHRNRGQGGKGGGVRTEDDEERRAGGDGLSAGAKEECRAAFALFFPDSPDESLDEKRIGRSDIVRVAGMLKEKITADEVLEMLEAFSTVRDKSLGLGDFERMMVAAKMV